MSTTADRLATIAANVKKVYEAGQAAGGVEGLGMSYNEHINSKTHKWERPSTWPDLDSIILDDNFDGVYLTYDLTTMDDPWIGVYVGTENTYSYTIERGHLVNGEFVSDYSQTVTSRYFRQDLDSANGDIQLWRISATEYDITRFGFATKRDSASAVDNNANNFQPCVERKGQLKYVTNISGVNDTVPTNICYSTIWLENDNIKMGSNAITTISSAWNASYRLAQIRLNDWDTSNWTITTLTNVWQNCYSLLELDLSNWDLSNNVITGLGSTWSGCYSLYKLDVSTWDTEKWEVSSLGYTWANCRSLTKLDVDNWNTTNWKVTNLNSTWSFCISLAELNISNWNTSNWKVTNLTATFQYCSMLKELNLSGWNVSNWGTITAINNWLAYTNGLRKLKGLNTWTFLKSFTTISQPNASPFLEDFDGIPYSLNQNYPNCQLLTHTSLVSMLNALPTVTATRTLKLGATNLNKLTSEEKAIATNKGWTLAA